MLNEFLTWYLAPWRRIPRWEFGVVLTVVSIPVLLFSVIGFGSSAGGLLGMAADAFYMGSQISGAVSGGDPNAMQQSLGAMHNMMAATGAPTPADTGHHVDWAGVLGALLLLATVPLCRMRLRDMGYWGKTEIVLTLLLNVSVLDDLGYALAGLHVLPGASLFSAANLIGYIWLCTAASKARVREETYGLPPSRLKALQDEPDYAKDDGEPPRNPFI